MPNESEQRAEFDSPWKEILTNYFDEFIAFFFPQAYSAIDWSKPYQFLDTELQQIVRDAELGKRIADKLAQVWLKNGESTWVLVHIEIQNQPQSDFAKRMYTQILHRHQKPGFLRVLQPESLDSTLINSVFQVLLRMVQDVSIPTITVSSTVTTAK